MSLKRMSISGFLFRFLFVLIPFAAVLITTDCKSQNISTVGEIYNYDIGDVFHYRKSAYWHNYGGWEKLRNEVITDKYYSQNNDTLFYMRDVIELILSQNPTDDWSHKVYNTFTDTLIYYNLDSLIRLGDIDTVFKDPNRYNSRKINYVDYYESGNKRRFETYVYGCGETEIIELEWFHESPDVHKRILIYYKKGEETWGEGFYVSVNETKLNTTKVSLYPNPARKVVTIDLPDVSETYVTVVTLHGKIVKTFELATGTVTMDVSDLSPGMYLFSIKIGDQLISKKLIIE